MNVLSRIVGITLAVSSFVASGAQFQPQARRDAAPPARVPDGVKAHRDLAYVENGHERQKLDLYLPEKAGAPLPLIIWIHGGAWSAGSKEGCPTLRQGFIERGYALASINYRLSSHAIFPAQIEDCKAAIRWLRAHAKQYNLNPDRFGVWGSSAGGHLVALVGTSGGVKEFDVGAHLDVSSCVQAVCDYYGPTDLLQMDAQKLPNAPFKHDMANSPESRLIGGPIQENKAKATRANPITYVTPDDPPFLIVHGNADPLVPIQQSQMLFEALKKTGVSVRFHTIKGAGHGQGFAGRHIDEMVNGFFDRCLKGTAAPAVAAEQTESEASAAPQAPQAGAGTSQRGPRFTWEQVRAREGVAEDGRVTRDKFKGPPPLFDRFDRNHDGVLTKEDFDDAGPARPAPPAKTSEPTPAPAPTSLLQPRGIFVCRGPNATPDRDVNHPFVDGWLVRPGWEKVEPRDGEFDWSFIENEIALAKRLGKKVTLSVLGGPQTPAWVYEAGAKAFDYTMPAGRRGPARIPLLWDEVYLKKWTALVQALGQRFNGEPTVVLVHITGATGNGLEMQLPFMPQDREQWRKAGYAPEKAATAWKRIVDAFAAAFPDKPLDIDVHPVLGSDDVANAIAAHCSQALGKRFGIFSGWLSGKPASDDRHHAGMQAIAAKYGPQGFAAFQMVASQTSNRSNPKFANLFATGGLQAAFEQGFSWNARYFEIWETDAANAALHPMLTEWAARLRSQPTAAAAGGTGKRFKLDGERWTCELGGQQLSGILLKPDGNGPFPAVLISHGLGGSAESFGLMKAREFLKWGVVCIAPNYTHNVRGAAKGDAPGGKAARGAQPSDYGASEENLRRARTCIEILRGLPYVDGQRIAAYGHSMGGFVTIGLAATSPDLLKAAAITGSGVAPRTGYPAPSAEFAAKIRAPFLILHGGSDPVVRPEQSASLKEVLDRNRVPNERRVFDGEGHAIDQSKREEVFGAMRDWFRRHGVLQP
jgi:acetyl esterase/lipase